MRTFPTIDSLKAAVGTHLGHSAWRTISQEQIDMFAQATGDHQWIHVDPERAKGGPFGATIAHGYLTLALVPQLVWEIYEVQGVRVGVNYGADSLRFPAPVRVGSRVRAGVELLDITERSSGHHVTSRVTIDIEGHDKPACVVETVSLLVA